MLEGYCNVFQRIFKLNQTIAGVNMKIIMKTHMFFRISATPLTTAFWLLVRSNQHENQKPPVSSYRTLEQTNLLLRHDAKAGLPWSPIAITLHQAPSSVALLPGRFNILQLLLPTTANGSSRFWEGAELQLIGAWHHRLIPNPHGQAP